MKTLNIDLLREILLHIKKFELVSTNKVLIGIDFSASQKQHNSRLWCRGVFSFEKIILTLWVALALIVSSAMAFAAAASAADEAGTFELTTAFITDADTEVEIVEVTVEAVQTLVAICLTTTSAGCFDF